MQYKLSQKGVLNIVEVLNYFKGSYQDKLDHFFKAIYCLDVARNFVSKAALEKARMKLKYDVFIELNFRLQFYTKVNDIESHERP